MLDRKTADPSPIRSGLLHGLISFAVFASAGGLVGGLIHITGDPAEAGPQHVIALFETEDGAVPALRGRLTKSASALVLADADTASTDNYSTQAPSLDVPDPDSYEGAASGPVTSAAGAPVQAKRGIRINGKLVEPGQRYSQLQASGTQADLSAAAESIPHK